MSRLGRLFGEIVERNALDQYRIPKRDGGFDFSSSTFSGKDSTGEFFRHHNHAYHLPADEDLDGHLDHLTVYCPSGFSDDEVAALSRFRRLHLDESMYLKVVMVGLGKAQDFRCSLIGPSRHWISATPFLVTRHRKTRGRKRDPDHFRGIDGRANFVAAVLQEEIVRYRDQSERTFALASDPEPLTKVGTRLALEFRRSRSKKSDDGFRRACGLFRFTFVEEVLGPLAWGHNGHFGLGLFQIDSQRS